MTTVTSIILKAERANSRQTLQRRLRVRSLQNTDAWKVAAPALEVPVPAPRMSLELAQL